MRFLGAGGKMGFGRGGKFESFYVGGYFTSANYENQVGFVDANFIAKWNGTAWSVVGSGFDDFGDEPYPLALALDSSDNLYAGGNFRRIGGINMRRIAKWNGTAWSSMGTMTGKVLALAVDSNDNLYAGGRFTTANGVTVNYVAKWNGTQWSALGTGVNSYVYALAIDSSDNLYAGGNFTTGNGVAANRIAKWNGTQWSALGTGMNSTVYALAFDSSGTLYAGGAFTTANGVSANNIAKWNGTQWSALGTGMNARAYALAVDSSDNLYAAGYFSAANGVSGLNGVAKWNGTQWSALGSGLQAYESYRPKAIAVDSSGNLYAGGAFRRNGDGVLVNYIAKWNGTSWNALGTGMNKYVYALAFDSSGVLYVGGSFTTAYNKIYSRFASLRKDVLSETPQ